MEMTGGYLTEPHSFHKFTHLIPHSGHWRPIDVLWGVFVGYFPWGYPALNHIIIVIGHFISSYLLFLFGIRFEFSKKTSFVATIVFALSGNVFATVYSIDSINQSLSLTFGLLGVWFCIKNEKIVYLPYIIFSILSVCAKETGFFFFLIGPSMRFVSNHRNIRSLKQIDISKELTPMSLS